MAQAVERVDPPTRTLTGASGGKIKNARPDRAYQFGNPHDDQFGCDAMENDGWRYIIVGSDKETCVGGKEIDGKKIAWRGQVLMWRPKADQDAFLAEKALYGERHEAAKRQPGGIDGVKSADGTPAEEIRKE